MVRSFARTHARALKARTRANESAVKSSMSKPAPLFGPAAVRASDRGTRVAPPTAAAPPDEALVRQLKAGDAVAGAELVQRYEGLLMGYLRRLAGSDHLAEELHQATWLSVLEHLEKFDAAGSAVGGFKAWLFRIATNKANDWWRRNGRERAAQQDLRLAGAEEHEPPNPTDVREQVAKLESAIAKLPEAQREVLLLRYYSGLKFVEIAATLGCPLNTALGRMHKAMNKLKRLMEE